jgi:DNA-binding NtrC family response regulator
MSNKHWQAKSIIDQLNSTELNKLLNYCKKQFSHVFKKTKADEADCVRAVDIALTNLKQGRPFVLKSILEKVEYDVIYRTLTKYKKQTRAANFLGLKEQTLRYKMIRLKIPTIRSDQTYYYAEVNEVKERELSSREK